MQIMEFAGMFEAILLHANLHGSRLIDNFGSQNFNLVLKINANRVEKSLQFSIEQTLNLANNLVNKTSKTF